MKLWEVGSSDFVEKLATVARVDLKRCKVTDQLLTALFPPKAEYFQIANRQYSWQEFPEKVEFFKITQERQRHFGSSSKIGDMRQECHDLPDIY